MSIGDMRQIKNQIIKEPNHDGHATLRDPQGDNTRPFSPLTGTK